MKLTPTKPDEENQIYSRLICEETNIFMGFWPVLFGVRVRAGYIGQPMVKIDWCCGDDKAIQVITYNMLREYLESDGDINKLPGSSKIKPWYKDPEFVDVVSELLNDTILKISENIHEKPN